MALLVPIPVIDALGVKASTGDDHSLNGSNAKVELSRTHADKTERFNELNEKVTESNSKKISLAGTTAKIKRERSAMGSGCPPEIKTS